MANNHVQKLGYGYDSETGRPIGVKCVSDAFINTGGKPYSTLKMTTALSYSQLQKELGIDIDASYKGGFSGSLEFDYAKSVKEGAYSMSFSVIARMEFETKIIEVMQYGVGALSPFGKGVYDKGLDHFREVCGDQFAIQENTGAMLIATLKINFNSRQAKKDFGLNLKAKASSFSFGLDIKKMSSEIRGSTTIEVTGMQKGGEVKMLPKLLGGDGDNPIMRCNLVEEESVDYCIRTFENMVSYAKETFVNTIIDDGDLSTKSTISHTYFPYKSIGINDLPSIAELERVNEIKEKYSLMYEKLEDISKYIQVLTGYGEIKGRIEQEGLVQTKMTGVWHWNPEYIHNQEQHKLSKVSATAKDLLKVIEDPSLGMPNCYKHYRNCEKVDAQISTVINLFILIGSDVKPEPLSA